jgi:hypothetical protein
MSVNTRWIYENGLLQRVEQYEEDRKTRKTTDAYEHDATGRLLAQTSAWAGDPPHSRVEYLRDQKGRLVGSRQFEDGVLTSTSEFKRSPEHVFAGVAHRGVDGSLHETWETRTPIESGGWSVVQRRRFERPAKAREPRQVDEYETPSILDSRGRTIEIREGGQCKYYEWDDESRCVGVTIWDACVDDPQVQRSLRTTIRREYGARLHDATTIYETRGKVDTVRHELDAAGNLIGIVRAQGSTTFEYEGEFRNAVCHRVEPPLGAELGSMDCDIPIADVR